MDLDFSGSLLFLLKLLLGCTSTQPSPLPPRRAAAAELKPLSPALALCSFTPSPHQRGTAAPAALIGLTGSPPARKSQVFYLCSVTIQLWNQTTSCQPTRRLAPAGKRRAAPKASFELDSWQKDCPAFIDNCFFPFQGTAFKPAAV